MDGLPEEIEGIVDKLDRQLNRGEITEREYDQLLANFECELNGSDPMYPWMQ